MRNLPRWSWRALLLSALPLGAIWASAMFISAGFRAGLDADMNMSLAQMSLAAILEGMAMFGLLGAAFVALGWGVAKWLKRGRRMFMALTVGIPASIIALIRLGMGMLAAVSTPSGVLFFESASLFYLPTWLDVGLTALAFLTSAWTYSALANAFGPAVRSHPPT